MIKLKSPNFVVSHFAAGDIIMCEGKKSNALCLVTKGRVGIYNNYKNYGETKLRTVEQEDFFGEMPFFTEKKSTETAVAQEECSIVALDRTDVFKFFMYEPESSVYIFKVLFNKIWGLHAALLKDAAPAAPAPAASGTKTKHESNPEYFFSVGGGDFYNFSINKTEESYFKIYPAQSVIINEEEQVSNIYAVMKGSSGIFRSRKKIADIRPGNFISGANFPGGVATETYAAIKETEMIVLKPDNVEKFFKNEPKSAFAVLKMFCDRIELLIHTAEVAKYGKQILPMGHKPADTPITTDGQYLQEKYYFCPVCQQSFKSLIYNDKLTSVASDDDSRLHYEGIEPLYYDVISCPACWYTALREYFDKGRATLQYFQKTMLPYKTKMQYNIDKSKYDINDVFLAYYFAMFCVNECFNTGRSLIHAKLWLRLSWLYNICGDEDQEMMAVKKARELFLAAFSESSMDDGKQAFPLMIVTGVVCNKVGDRKNAKFFLSQVVLKSGADKYKERAKELLKKYELV